MRSDLQHNLQFPFEIHFLNRHVEPLHNQHHVEARQHLLGDVEVTLREWQVRVQFCVRSAPFRSFPPTLVFGLLAATAAFRVKPGVIIRKVDTLVEFYTLHSVEFWDSATLTKARHRR